MKKEYKNLIILIAVVLLLRLLFISIDPPLWATDDQGLFADEGYKTLSAKNKVIYGEHHVSEYDSYFGWNTISPVSYISFIASFSIFGTGFIPARLVTILFSVLSVLLLYFITKKAYGIKEATVAAIILGANFTYLIYSKLALLEPIVTFFILLSILLWQLSEKKTWLLLASIALFILAYQTKPIGIIFLPALIYMVWIRLKPKDFKINKKIMPLFIGIIAVIAAFLIIFPEIIRSFIGFASQRVPDSPKAAIILFQQFWHEPYFIFNTILSLFVLGYILIVVAESLKKKIPRKIDIIFILWGVAAAALLIVQHYRPLRYFSVLTPALAFMAGIFIMHNKKIFDYMRKKNPKKKLLLGTTFVGLLLIVTSIYRPLLFSFPSISEHKAFFFLGVLIISSILTIGINIIFVKNKRINWRYLILAYLIINLLLIGAWYVQPERTLVESSKDFGTYIPEDASVLGINWPQALCMETPNKCYVVTGTNNEANLAFDALNITYFVTDDYTNPDYNVEFLNNNRFNQSICLVKTYLIGHFDVYVYEFDKEYFYNRSQETDCQTIQGLP